MSRLTRKLRKQVRTLEGRVATIERVLVDEMVRKVCQRTSEMRSEMHGLLPDADGLYQVGDTKHLRECAKTNALLDLQVPDIAAKAACTCGSNPEEKPE